MDDAALTDSRASDIPSSFVQGGAGALLSVWDPTLLAPRGGVGYTFGRFDRPTANHKY